MTFFKKHLKKGFKFCVVGSFGTIPNLAIVSGLVAWLGSWNLLIGIAGIFGGMVFNYFLNYYWTFRTNKIQVFRMQLEKIGFHRVVFERFQDPRKYVSVTQDGVLFDDKSPPGFYPTVVVPTYLIGKTLFIIDDEWLQKFLKSLQED